MRHTDGLLASYTPHWLSRFKSFGRDPYTLGLWALPLVWTLLLAASMWLNLSQLDATVQDMALVAARANFQRDVLIRQWASNHGGVYVPVTDQTPPNPYLSDLPERDITTPSGRQLTLMNPAYITRQLHELSQQSSESTGHITSLNPLRPANAPDDWERQALEAFERGVTEVSAVQDINGEAYLRLMRPLMTTESCLACHAAQGYQVGDIRGGISESVRLIEYKAIVAPNQRNVTLIHGIFWITGLALIAAGLWQIQRRRRERDLVSAALRNSEARFRSYFDLPLAGRAITSPDKGWLEVNPTLCNMLGYTKAELSRLTWAQLTHPDDLPADEAQFKRVMTGEIDGYTLEKRFLRQDGQIIYADLAVQCVRRPDGTADYFVALIQDITARKHADEALRQSEARYRDLFENAPIGIYRTTPDGHILAANPALLRLLDYDSFAELAQHDVEAEPDALDGRQPFKTQIERDGVIIGREAIWRRRDGRQIYVRENARLVRDDDGQPLYYDGTVEDVTERKQMEAALQISLTKYQTLFDSLPLGVTVADRTGQITENNQEATRLLGLSPDAQHQRQIDDEEWRIIQPDGSPMPPEEFASVRALKEQRRIANVEMGLVKKSAETTWISVTAVPVPLPDQGVIIAYTDISERRQMEVALRETRDQISQLLQTTDQGIYGLDLNGCCTFINQSGLKLLGYELAECLGQDMHALVHHSRADGSPYPEAECPIYQLRFTAAGCRLDHEVFWRKDGRAIPVEYSAYPIIVAGHTRGIVVTFSDITERKQAEEALRQSEARWHSVIKTSPDGICLATIDGVIQYASDKLLALHGYERPEELFGRNMFELLAADYRAEATSRMRQMLGGHYPGVTEYRVTRRDGSQFFAEINAEVLRDAVGRPTGLLLVERDVDDRKRAEDAVRRQNQYLTALQETTLELSAQLDLDRLFENIVTRAAGLVDAAGGFFDMVDQGSQQLLPRVGMGVLAESLHHVARPGEGVAGIVWQTGQPLVVNHYDQWTNRIGGFSQNKIGAIIGVPLINNGQTLGVLGLAYSIDATQTFGPEAVAILTQFARLAAIAINNARLFDTVQRELAERTKAEAALRDLNATLELRVAQRTVELQTANRRLTELDRLKDEFLSRISHELRTPLTSIKIYIELLETARLEKRDKYLQTLKHEADRLHGLIEEVLLFSQLNLNTESSSAGPLDVNYWIESRLTTWVRLSSGRDAVQFRLTLAQDLPWARADGELIIQALTRLIANAAHYTPSGSVTVSTALQTADDDQWVTVSVADTGPGITPEDLPHIFERFYRGRAAADYKTPGTGIGLSICREIAEKLGGRLTVETQVGVGSTFTLWLPKA